MEGKIYILINSNIDISTLTEEELYYLILSILFCFITSFIPKKNNLNLIFPVSSQIN